MGTDPCSGWAYADIKASGYLGIVQAEVAGALAFFYPQAVSGRQIVEWVSANVNPKANDNTRSYSPRTAELVKMGFAQKSGYVFDEVTGKTVRTWRWTGRKDPLKVEIVIKCCPRCKGAGQVTVKEYKNDSAL